VHQTGFHVLWNTLELVSILLGCSSVEQHSQRIFKGGCPVCVELGQASLGASNVADERQGQAIGISCASLQKTPCGQRVVGWTDNDKFSLLCI
jgi:hypothetical protein